MSTQPGHARTGRDGGGAADAGVPAMGERIEIAGTYNFRHVAMALADGRRMPSGRLYRSDALARLTRRGRMQLAKLGVRLVIDLRSDMDRRFGGQDRLRGTGAELLRVPVLGAAVLRDTSGVDLRGVYRHILTECGNQIGVAIRAIGEARGPVVVHCTAGKDRTGLVVALTLLAVGVEVDDVVADYAATEDLLAGEWTARMLKKVRRLRVPITEPLLEVIARSPEPVLRDTLAWVEQTFGSVEAYLISIGVGQAQVASLRRALLQ